MRYEVTVLADDGDLDDPGQVELGTVILTKESEQQAVQAAHAALWDDRLNATSFPRYRVRELGEALDTGQAAA